MSPISADATREKVEAFRRKHRIGLLTLLFTDIIDSTKLKQSLGDREAVALIQGHHDAIRDILSRFNEGEEIETAGDAFFIVFAKPSDAVKFSLLAQAKLRALAGTTGHSIFDRIGIHVGEVWIEERDTARKPKDLYGIQVDSCARVASLGGADQILMTRFSFDSARQVLKNEELKGIGPLSWLNHGPYSLKGVEEPIEVCEVGEIGLAKLTPPGNSEKAHRFISADTEPVLGWRPAIDQQVPGTSWVLEKKLGEGGFGEVWLGCDKVLKTLHVFKFCFRADRVRALKREVTLFRLLQQRVANHQNIVGVEATYFDEPPFYVVMQHVDGSDLPHWCEQHEGVGSIPLSVKLEIIAQVADALQAAHDSGIIHRDVKPSNILVSGNQTEVHAYLTDFGIGQVVSEEVLRGVSRMGFTETLGDPASHSGTYLYMAPELFAGKPASIRSDIYALGMVLYQTIVGDFTRPFTGDWSRQISNPLLREDLEKCFAGDPAERFAGASQLADRIRSLETRTKAVATQEAAVKARELAAYRRGIWRTAAVATLVILLILGLAVYSFQQARRADRNAQEARFMLSRSAFLQALRSINEDRDLDALAILARSLSVDRGYQALAGWRLTTLLMSRDYAIPLLRLKHDRDVRSAQFSPDSKRIVTGSSDKTARVWDAETGKPLTVAMKHDHDVHSAQFSPDGRRIVTASGDLTARVWDAQTGEPLTEPMKHHSSVTCAQFSPDGKRIVTASWDGMTNSGYALVWDAQIGKPLSEPMKHHNSLVSSAQFSPDGRRIVTASGDLTARVWDAQTGKPLTEPMKHDGEVRSAQFSPDGKRIVTASADKTARVWDAQTGKPLTEPMKHDGEVRSAQFSPDGKRIVTASDDKTARVWDAETGKPLTDPIKHKDPIVSAQFSPDGKRIVTASPSQSVWGSTTRVWDTLTGKPLTEPMKDYGWVHCAQFSPDGKRIVATFEVFGAKAGTAWGYARVWDALTGKSAPQAIQHDDEVHSAQFSPDGKRIVTASADKTARVWDALTGKPLTEPMKHDDDVHSSQFSPDGKRIVTVCKGPQQSFYVRIWNAETGKPRTEPMKYDGDGRLARFSLDGKRIVTACTSPQEPWYARVWDAETGKPLGPSMKNDRTPLDGINSAEFSPDGKRVVTATLLGTLRVWDAVTGKPLTEPMKHDGVHHSAQFSPDGRRIVITRFEAKSGYAQVLDAETGKPLGQPMKHDGVVNARFSPDGKRIVTASWDHTARVWDAETGKPLTEPMSHWGVVGSARFSPDGRRIVTTSQFGGAVPGWCALVWDAVTGKPLGQPMIHDSFFSSAQFSPDGTLIVTASDDHTARVWDMMPTAETWPEWLPRLAEAIAGQHYENDVFVPTSKIPPKYSRRSKTS